MSYDNSIWSTTPRQTYLSYLPKTLKLMHSLYWGTNFEVAHIVSLINCQRPHFTKRRCLLWGWQHICLLETQCDFLDILFRVPVHIIPILRILYSWGLFGRWIFSAFFHHIMKLVDMFLCKGRESQEMFVHGVQCAEDSFLYVVLMLRVWHGSTTKLWVWVG